LVQPITSIAGLKKRGQEWSARRCHATGLEEGNGGRFAQFVRLTCSRGLPADDRRLGVFSFAFLPILKDY
jgi:hypothetical protein